MGFRLKTILGIAAIEAALLLALVVSSLAYLRESNQQELRRHAVTAATLFATAGADAVLSTDLARLQQLSNDFLTNPGVRYLRVADQDRILLQTGDAEVLQRPFHADEALADVDDGVYDVTVPIYEAGQEYGRIEMGLSVSAVQELIDAARRHIVALAVVEMLLVALFSWLLGSYLTRQLRDLENASHSVADGDFNVSLPVTGRDELTDVAVAFNRMSERIGNFYRELQLALFESQLRGERLQAVVNSILDGLVVIDTKGSITMFNLGAEKIFGYAKEEVVGRNVNMLMPEPYAGAHDGYLHNYLNTGVKHIIGIGREVYGQRKDGSAFPMDLSITELRMTGEHSFIGLVRDISERKALHEQLYASNRMKKAMLDSSLDGIVTIDSQGCICEFNPSAALIFGYKPDEALGKSMAELLIPEPYREAHRLGLQRYMATGQGKVLGQRIELTALHRSGETFPIELAITPIHQDGQIFFTAFVRDIRETKQAQESLQLGREQAEKASLIKSQFLAMMSHELRTPLNAMLGVQEMLIDSALDDAQKRYLALAKDAGDTMLALINDILDLSKVEAGRLELENAAFDVVDVIEETLQIIDVKAKEKRLALKHSVSPDIARWVSGDPLRFRQVLLNLLSNAVKFTAEGSVTLKVTRRPEGLGDGLLTVEVVDTGIGIDPAAQSRLFEAFTQVDPSDTRKYGGSGLGLAISKRLVELWGGHIGLESRLGSGSRFWFSFGRIADPADAPTPVGKNEKTAAAFGPFRLLLVEDSPTNQIVLASMLRGGGHRVDVADNGAAAIAAVKAGDYDLIFMDVSMPDMSGMDATRHIRQLGGAAASVPVIALTAHAVKGYRESCLDAGMNDYATKPIGKQDLLELVQRWCGTAAVAEAVTPVLAQERDETAFLDDAVLRQVAADAGMEQDLSPLLRIFIDELNSRHSAIAEAVERRNLAGLAHESHALKSSAATFGAWPLHRLAKELDASCKKGDLPSALTLAGELMPCAQSTLEELKRRCKAL